MIRDGIKDLGKYSYAQKIKEKVRKLFFFIFKNGVRYTSKIDNTKFRWRQSNTSK